MFIYIILSETSKYCTDLGCKSRTLFPSLMYVYVAETPTRVCLIIFPEETCVTLTIALYGELMPTYTRSEGRREARTHVSKHPSRCPEEVGDGLRGELGLLPQHIGI